MSIEVDNKDNKDNNQNNNNQTQRYNLPQIPLNWNSTLTGETGLLIKTYSYFQYDEASSALQKSIRRGLEFETVQWCVEMWYTNDVARTNLWNRLFTIAVEDVGLGNPSAIFQILHLYNTDCKNILNLVTGALYLAQSMKCRANDWALHYLDLSESINVNVNKEVNKEVNNKTNNINLNEIKNSLIQNLLQKDYINAILNTGKLMYTNLKIAGRYKNPIILIWNAIFTVITKNNINYKYVKELYELYMSSNWRWSGRGNLLIIHLIFMICLNLDDNEIVLLEANLLKLKLNPYIQIAVSRKLLLGMPVYAIDKHTRLGRKLGKTIDDFIRVGSICTNLHPEYIELNDYYFRLVFGNF